LEKVYGGIIKEVNEVWLQIASNNTLSAIDHQSKTFNTNISKLQAQDVVFWPPDDIELVNWTPTSKCARYCFVRIFTTNVFSN
jgi:hypothetical protein